MSDLLARIEKLSPKQRALLQLRKADKLNVPPLARTGYGARVPLSFAQQRLWFIDQLEPGSAVYNVPIALRVQGEFEISVFERVVNEIVRRHEVLRTTYKLVNEEVWQEISPAEGQRIVVEDLRGASAEEREKRTEQEIREEAQKPFDLAHGPLLRVKVLRLAEAEYLILATMHHIVSDGWSKGIFIREFAALYEAFRRGAPSPLPELPIQYADYVNWQRGWLQGEVLERQLSYWREHLAGVETMELPTDYPRSAVLSERGGSVPFELPAELTARLKEMSQRERATLFMLLLASFQVLLSRYSGQQDIAVGTPIANRRKVETEALIGFFVNTLVLRTNVSGSQTFRELLAGVRERTLKAYDHQDLPFEKLVEELHPDRYSNRSPLFQVMFALQNAPRTELQLSGMKLSAIESAVETAHFELFLSAAEEHGALRGILSFRTDRFAESTMRRFLEHWQNLLISIVENPGQLCELEVLSEAERQHLIEEWNRTDVEYPQLPVYRMFEEQAAKTPAAVAVEFAGQQLNYAELNQRANQLAHYLREVGAGDKALVGICVERSLEMTVALLAILKAGCAYVPLDPKYPSDRLSYMFENAGIDVLVTQEHFLSIFAGMAGLAICLDRDLPLVSKGKETNLTVAVDHEDLVYVIYTSGSTGKPKGVAMRHGAASNLLQWQLRQNPDFSPCRTLQFASLSFDVSFQEIFATWCEGGCLVVVGEDTRRDPFELWKALHDQKVERIFLPFVALQQLAEAAPADSSKSSLRQIITAGEQLKISPALQKLMQYLSACILENQYGPSESHVVTAYRLGNDSSEWVALPPIGKPIANTQVYVLNEGYMPVPVRVAGELYLAGFQLARGYVNRPELTAERFLPNPFSKNSGERMYRTGDKVRYLETGDIEYLGRMDRQVKVRGYRIELEEIEAALLGHAEIEQVAVAVQGAEQRLVGYVVQKGKESKVSGADLRDYLKARLPEYMVPGMIVNLEELPLTPSGKVDRKALPEPQVEPDHPIAQRIPRNYEEKVLSEILTQVLKRENVGLDENFFESGGHSLLAMQVISRARTAFDIDLPVRALFEAPTVAGLAERVIGIRAQGGRTKTPAIGRVKREGVLELSYAQQRLWFLMQVMPGNTSYNIPLALRLRGELNVEALKRSIREIVRRHEVLRTRFETVNGKPRQIIEGEIELDLEVKELKGAEEGEREEELMRVAVEEAQKPFDLEKGPMVRVGLVRVGEQDHGLLMTMHHIVSDAVSTGVAVREMTALYAAYSRGEESPLEELPIQYADYAGWQRGWLKGEVLEEQMEYWKVELEGVKPLALATDRPLRPQMSARSGFARLRMGKEATAKLKKLSEREEVTMFMVLMGAYQVLLYRYSGQEDFAVGTPIAGRTATETEKLIGFFVNTLVLPAEVGGNPSFREVLRRMKEKTVGAYAHQDVPFERLVDSLQIERNVNRSPLFQASLAFQNVDIGNLALGDVKLATLDALNRMAKFELLLSIKEVEEELLGSMQYYAELFDESTMKVMMERLERVLEEVAEKPEQRIDGIELLREVEREQVRSTWRGEEVKSRGAETLGELVRMHAGKRPGSVAVVGSDGRELSYQELEQESSRVGKRLRREGVRGGGIVGISVEGAREWVIAAVGVLKAGGAFVGVEGGDPERRRRWFIEDTGAEWVITDERESWGEERGREKLLTVEELTVEEPKSVAEGEEGEEEGWEVEKEEKEGGSLGCVVYRSGRKGKPESIWISQRTLSGRGAVRVGEEERVAMRVGMEEEGSLEVLRVLAAGGCVVEVRKRPALAPRRMAELVSEQGSRVVWGKAGELERLAREFPAALEGVRVMVCEEGWRGQKWLAEAVGEEVLERVYGAYGMAEAGGVGLLYPLRELLGEGGGEWRRMRMEEVVGGKRIHLLDGEMREVAEGVVGEIYVGGEEQAWGNGEAGETAEKWVPDPWSEREGGRLYRTGDLGRRRGEEGKKEGIVEYVGRRDRRSVVEGVRVYEEEIEEALREAVGVEEARVVISHGSQGSSQGGGKGNRGEARITGWVKRRSGEGGKEREKLKLEELMEGLKEKLPGRMIPEKLLEVEEWPRRGNGEINGEALQRRLEESAGVKEYTPAGTEEEEKLVQVWEETLEKKPIGVHDNFFNIGGDSLLATQVVARMSAALEVELPLRRLFESPTIAQLAPVMAEMRKAGGWRKPAIGRVKREGVLELSYAQQRLWFLMQMMPESTSYHIPIGLRLRGELNVEALKRSIREIVRRHEVLRTRFETVNGKPRQIIEGEIELDLEVKELKGAEEGEREEELMRVAVEEAQKPFDLEKGPMVRVGLVRVGEQDHGLLMTMHHIVSDAVSTGVAVREMTALYAAYSRGEESPLEELPIQYADYAGWQRGWLKGEVLEEQMEYWKVELEGVKPLALATDRPLRPQMSARSGFAWLRMGKEATAKLKKLSEREEVTMFMVLMGAYQVLLYRYSGQKDFAVGTPIAGRTATETEKLIGFFVNTLVLPAEVGGNPSFREVLRRMKEKTVGAYAHQDVPFERLVDSLQIERNVNRSPLFQAMFAFQNAGLGAGLDLGQELKLEGINILNSMAAKFELLLSIKEVEEELLGSMQYYAELFDESTMKVMMERLERVLEEVAEKPEQRIDGIELLREVEREQVRSTWRGEEVKSRGGETLAELVRMHAGKRPGSVAVVGSDGRELSYQELEQESSRVGKRLRREGVRGGGIVGISVEGAREWVIAAVGVLKAGGAFVGVEGGDPERRRRWFIEDTGAEWVITDERESWGEERGREKLLTVEELTVEEPKSVAEGEEGEEEGWEVEKEEKEGGSLGCVVYRSGRKGKPESIWISQRTLSGRGAVRVGEEERVAMRVGMEEEGSLEVLRVLAAGGCVVEVRKRPALAPRRMAELVSEQGSRVVWGKAGELERLAREFPAALEGVRVMVCEEGWRGQKWLAEAVGEEVLERVYGAYGMAEAGGVGLLYPLRELLGEGGGEWRRMRMEEVVGGKRIHLLDGEMREVAEGVVGEIYVGGEEQAWGNGEAGETAEKWVPDPWSEREGGRLYRTGDLGRRRGEEGKKEGIVEYVGRRDRRSVVEGVRVYEEEIEEALREAVGVEEARVVISHGSQGSSQGGGKGNRGEARITGWVKRRSGEGGKEREKLKLEELMEGLKEKLPGRMIPEKLLEVEEWPRRGNGEINGEALQRRLEESAGVKEYTPAGTEEEEKLVQVWEETLEKKPIGVHDNFFNIGGDSLLATQVVARMSAALEVELPLRRLFESPTIAQLAPVMAEMRKAGGWRKPAIGRVKREGVLELSYAQQRLWFLMQVMPGNTSYNIPLALRLRGELNVEALKRSIREIVRRHEVLRTRFETVNGKPRQIIEGEIELDLEVKELKGAEEGEREEELMRVAVEEAQKPFDLEKGPMVRVGLVRVGEQDHGLLMTMHHIVSDAVSTGVAVREMTALYAAYSRGEESPLEELPIQYADYAGWQRGWLKGEVLEEQVEYWKVELEGVKPLALATDRPLRPQMSARSGFARLRMGKEATAKLKKLSEREEVTMFMVLMGAYQVLLYRYSGQEDFAVGTPIAGRTATETEKLIGFFVNTLVLPAEVGGNPSFREVLRRMKEKTVGAYAHQDVPFERLVDSLQIERNVNRSPLFQTMFAFQNAGLGAGLDLGQELKLEGINVGMGIAAKFELLLAIGDMQDMLVASMQYYAELFDESTMKVMMERLERVLEEVAEKPEQRIDGIELLREVEREQVRSTWRGEEVKSRGAETVAELVRMHAGKRPGSVAVVGSDGRELSYQELEQESSRVGKRLRREGVRGGGIVGISVEGAREWVIAAVGVLKAGGAFVGVEGGDPERRRRWFIEDTGAEWVITDERESWGEERGREKLLTVEELTVEEPKSVAEGEEGEEEGWEVEKEEKEGGSLGCVVYRSGRKGKPESIWISQRTLSGRGAVRVGEEERVAMRVGMEEEGSLEVLRVLAAGGCVVEVRKRPALAPRRMAELVSEQGSRVVWGKAGELERLAREFPAALEGVRVMVCEEGWRGQKWLAEAVGEEVLERVYGAYGMAEAGGVGLLYPLRELLGEGGGEWRRMRMEEVVGGKRIHLLDGEMREVAEGVVGEIYVGGEEQAWGNGEAGETAEKWVPDPWSEREGGRLYRTGDLGRRRGEEGKKEGIVEYVGRRDRRSVVEGVRVYEEEIEEALREAVGVEEARVVISHGSQGSSQGGGKGNRGEARITGWVKRRSGEGGKEREKLKLEELMEGLKEKLPGRMIPEKLLEVEEWPRRGNGEINGEALQRRLEESAGVKEYTPAGTEEEEKLVQVWEETLEKKPIGVHDNFFNIGGNSLLATQAVARMSAALEVELPLRRLFESPTIAQLAPVIVSLRDKPDEQAPDIPSSLVPIHVVNGGETLFCFHPLGGGISSFRSLIDLLPGVSIYGLQSEGFSLAESIRHTTVESMARYYVELIRSVQKNGPYWLLGRSSGGHLAFEASRILTQMGEEVAGVMLLDTAAPGRLPWNPTDLNLIKLMAEGALDEDEQELSKLVGDEQLAYALQQLKKRGLVPSNYSFDLGRRRLAVVKNNLMAANKYLPGPYHGHVTLFAAEGSPLENIDVWKTFVPASLQVEHVSGQHAQLLTEPFVRQIAAHIQTSMGSATKGKTFAAAQMIS